jgi:hypothetical protein
VVNYYNKTKGSDITKKVKLTDELNNYIGEVLAGSLPPYPKGGSRSFYPDNMFKHLNKIKSSSAIRLFLALIIGSNEYNLITVNREQMAHAIRTKYDRANMAKLLRILEDDGLIMPFSGSHLINPYVVLPRIREPRLKEAIQEVWIMEGGFPE